MAEPVQLLTGLATVDHLNTCTDLNKHLRKPRKKNPFSNAEHKYHKIKPDNYHFADGASFLCPFLTTGCAEVCVHEAHLPRDGLGEHRQSGWVTSLSEKDW